MSDIKWLPVMSAQSESLSILAMANVPILLHSVYTGQFAASRKLPLCLPKSCPLCDKLFGKSIIPITSVSNLCFDNGVSENVSSCDVISIYHCINCDSLFAVKYKIEAIGSLLSDLDDDENSEECRVKCSISGYLPAFQSLCCFSDYVNEMFPVFVNIYHQAEKAEFLGLTDICGMGYRKALEFLVQSYVEYKENGLPDGFDDMTLSQKITKYIRDDNIKTLVERAVWLGNDNVHIVQKHSDYSVDDMKRFILSVISYFDFEQTVQKASEIQRK